MATDTSGLDEGNEQEHAPEGSGLGGFAVGVIFGAHPGMELGQRVFSCGYDEENVTSASNQHDAGFRSYYRSRSWARA